jgi:hypothetical protein
MWLITTQIIADMSVAENLSHEICLTSSWLWSLEQLSGRSGFLSSIKGGNTQ